MIINLLTTIVYIYILNIKNFNKSTLLWYGIIELEHLLMILSNSSSILYILDDLEIILDIIASKIDILTISCNLK